MIIRRTFFFRLIMKFMSICGCEWKYGNKWGVWRQNILMKLPTTEGSRHVHLWFCHQKRTEKKNKYQRVKTEEKRENVCGASRIEISRREFFLLILFLLSVICVYYPKMSGSSSCIGLILWDFSSHSFFLYIYI